MLQIRAKISILVLVGLLATANMTVFGQYKVPKGSRLYLKPAQNTTSKLTFKKGKPLLPFAGPTQAKLEIQPSKTANLYFTNYLTNRNLTASKPNPEYSTKTTSTNVAADTPKTSNVSNPKASNAEYIEPGERLFYSENLQITNVFPNPANEYAFFDYNFTGGYNTVKIALYNVLGSPTNVVAILDKNERKARLYVKELNSGIYFYQLIADGKTLATKKLLVRHIN
jgi:hypothetical protein